MKAYVLEVIKGSNYTPPKKKRKKVKKTHIKQ